MTLDEQIGEQVHQVMWRKKFAQRQLADELALTQAGISKKIRGHRPFFAGEIIKIATLLGVEVAELLPRLDSNQQPAGYETVAA